jgi:hypothetical protein
MYNTISYKTKQFLWLVIKLSIVIGCCTFIYLKVTGNEQISFAHFYQNMSKNSLFTLKNALLLTLFSLFNWFFEILKWRSLVSFIKPTSIFSAGVQSFAALTTSLITPNRIGEYGAKALYFEKPYRKQIVGINLIGHMYQMGITLLFGLLGFGYIVFCRSIKINFNSVFNALLLSLFLILVLLFSVKYFKSRWFSFQKARDFTKKIPKQLHLKVGLLSLVRYLIFSHQFYFLLCIFKINLPYITAISAITSVYFIASLVPILSLLDFVLKGTVAVWIFSHFQVPAAPILSITSLLWIFNFALPAILGSYFVLSFKPIEAP